MAYDRRGHNPFKHITSLDTTQEIKNDPDKRSELLKSMEDKKANKRVPLTKKFWLRDSSKTIDYYYLWCTSGGPNRPRFVSTRIRDNATVFEFKSWDEARGFCKGLQYLGVGEYHPVSYKEPKFKR